METSIVYTTRQIETIIRLMAVFDTDNNIEIVVTDNSVVPSIYGRANYYIIIIKRIDEFRLTNNVNVAPA